ncbi:MAG TPA: cyclic lactone autoinducer peptide [Syntrophomonadaceae bacterium]|nr:cyclic lactone autoinducer peptide [Syntrophomonadaceae bacterium]
MKKVAFRFSGLLVAILTVVGNMSPMCVLFHYQPEVPASLRK